MLTSAFLQFCLFSPKNGEFSPKISFYASESVLFYFKLAILLHLESWKVFLKVSKKYLCQRIYILANFRHIIPIFNL